MTPASRPAIRTGPPSIPAVVFIVLTVLVPLGLAEPLLNSDGDLARHLRHGRYMLEHGALIRADPFSFTRPGEPFVGFEYGSQILLALAERVGGLPGVAILCGLLIGAAYALLARFLLRRGVDPFLAYLTTMLAALIGSGHWLARPHLVSFVAVVILLGLLERRPQGPAIKAIVPFAALFAVWANLHGGFIYGWMMIAVYLAGSLGELLVGSDRAEWMARARYYAVALASAVTATLLTPYGFALHRHLLEFLGQRFMFDHTAEFTSPDFHEIGPKIFLAILLLGIIGLSLAGRRPVLPRLLWICAATWFGLVAERHISLFGLTALPLLALHLNETLRRLPDPRGIRGRFEATAGRGATLVWALPFVLLLCGLGLARGRVGPTRLVPDRLDPTVFPVAAVEEGRRQGLQGRLFSEFTWGGYLVYAWPEQKIFIDGGTDFFGEDIFRQSWDIKRLTPGWRELLQRWDISLMLLRQDSPLAHELVRDRRWNLWYCDSLAVMLQRRPPPDSAVPPVAAEVEADSAEHALDGCAHKPSDPPGDLVR